MERVYTKLVRDKIPDIIKNNGEIAVTKVLNDTEYKKELEKKLFEEYNEVLGAKGEDYLEELADMIEVIKALAKTENKTLEDILLLADKKNQKNGSFNDKIYLEKVIEKSFKSQ